jgi:hypothetical protein
MDFRRSEKPRRYGALNAAPAIPFTGSSGIPIQFVSRQLGHGGVSVTDQHYAKYLGANGDEFVYVEPARLDPGEIPADLPAPRLADCSQRRRVRGSERSRR